MSQSVSWQVAKRRGMKGMIARSLEITGAVADLRSGWHLAPIDARIPDGRTTPLALPPPLIRGDASFLPRYLDYPGTEITLYRDRATIVVAHGFESVETQVPLRELRIVEAISRTGDLFPTAATSEWELSLTNAQEERVAILGH